MSPIRCQRRRQRRSDKIKFYDKILELFSLGAHFIVGSRVISMDKSITVFEWVFFVSQHRDLMLCEVRMLPVAIFKYNPPGIVHQDVLGQASQKSHSRLSYEGAQSWRRSEAYLTLLPYATAPQDARLGQKTTYYWLVRHRADPPPPWPTVGTISPAQLKLSNLLTISTIYTIVKCFSG